MNTVAISGNTYPVKDQIKALGGRWNADRKAWMVPADRATQAQALVSGAPKTSYSPRRLTNGDAYYSRNNGERLIFGCSNCRNLGRMCQSCQHDDE